jgi:hypothetical protein
MRIAVVPYRAAGEIDATPKLLILARLTKRRKRRSSKKKYLGNRSEYITKAVANPGK